MSEKRHDLFDAARGEARRQHRTVDQDDRQAQRARRVELRPRACAAGVLGDDEVDAVAGQKFPVGSLGEGAARDDGRGIGQGQGDIGRIDEPEQIMVLRLDGEGAQALPADGKEDPRRCDRKGLDGRVHVGHMAPGVAEAGDPRRALEGGKRDAGRPAGGNRVPAHLRCERMGRVDHMGDPFGAQIAHQPLHAAEAADPGRQRLRPRRIGAPGIGKDRVGPRGGKGAGKPAGLGRAAEKKDARHG